MAIQNKDLEKGSKRWAANVVAALNRNKDELGAKFSRLESLTEIRMLTEEEHKEYKSVEAGTRKNMGSRGD